MSGLLFALSPEFFTRLLLFPILLVVLLVIWALPDTEQPPATLLRRAFFCYLTAIAVWPYYLAVQIPGLPLLEPRRVASILVLASLLIGVSVSPRFRRYIADLARETPWLFRAIIVYLGVQIITIGLSRAPADSFSYFLKDLMNETGMLFAAIIVFADRDAWKDLRKLIMGLAFFLSIIALAEYRNQGILWANHIPSFLAVSDPAMQDLLTPVFREGDYRVTGPFSVSLCFAEFLSLTMPFILTEVFFAKTFTRRALALALDALVLAAILTTQARTGVIGATIAHLTFGGLWAFRTWRSKPNDILGPFLGVSAVLGGIAFLFALMFVPAVYIRLLGGGSTQYSNEGRTAQLDKAWDLIFGQGAVGYGPGQGAIVLDYRNLAGLLSIDIGYLRIVLDSGIIGLIAYVVIFGGLFFRMIRRSLENTPNAQIYMALTACFGIWLVSRLVLAQNDNSSFLYILVGAAISLSASIKIGDRIKEKPRSVSLTPIARGAST
ncbi:O-antigen ligase family protein [Qipengyuania sp.]|uniref:O-antigen ligase family protein n=1 Tax=Qipengyuania sp. TaxID=2004515 RepID=UPI0035C79BC0